MTGNQQLLDRPIPSLSDTETPDIEALFKEARRRQRRRRAFATLGTIVAVIAIVAGVLAVVGATSNSGTARTHSPAAPIPTVVAAGAFAGSWSIHTASLSITSNGHGTIVYPFDVRCGSGPFESSSPCDVWVGNEILPGGHAEILLTNVGKATATGRIINSNDQAIIPNTSVTLRLGSLYGVELLYVTSTSPRPLRSFLTVPLCSPAARRYSSSHTSKTAPLLNCGA